jgi:hypothetical protein
MNQSAVEQFIEQLEQQGNSWENASIGRMNISIKIEDYLKLIEQAKEMEKEQQRQKMIDLLVWINNVSSENPMALETENDDIVDMFLNEYYNLKSE